MQSNGNSIFVGMRISDTLRQHLDSSKTSVRQFFAENDPQYLLMMHIDQDEYIGKVSDSGASFEDLSNTFMNMKTMLRMICPKFSLPENAIRILALAPAQAQGRTYY